MAYEFHHRPVGYILDQSEWEASNAHVAENQQTGDYLIFDGNLWRRQTGLLPLTDNSYYLGSSTVGWKGIYFPDLKFDQYDATAFEIRKNNNTANGKLLVGAVGVGQDIIPDEIGDDGYANSAQLFSRFNITDPGDQKYAVYGISWLTLTANNNKEALGVLGNAAMASTNAANLTGMLRGVVSEVDLRQSMVAPYQVQEGELFSGRIFVRANTTLVNAINYYVRNASNAGTITNQYGIYIENMTAGALNYSIYSMGGTYHLAGIPIYANNAAATTGGLISGDLYRTNGDPDTVCVVH